MALRLLRRRPQEHLTQATPGAPIEVFVPGALVGLGNPRDYLETGRFVELEDGRVALVSQVTVEPSGLSLLCYTVL